MCDYFVALGINWVFENFNGKNSQIASLNRNRYISVEATSKGWMFFIANDTKSFMKPECFVSQNSAMAHPYKRAIADVLSGRKSLVPWILVIANSDRAKGFCLI